MMRRMVFGWGLALVVMMLVFLSVGQISQAQNTAVETQPTQLDILFVGDSITDFWDNGGRGLEVYKKYYDGPRRVMNIGASGDITDQTMRRLEQPRVANIKPTMIMLMIGTNNLDRGPEKTPEYTLKGIKTILDTLQTKWPEAKILLLGVLPRAKDPDSHYRAKIQAINEQLPKLADRNRIIFKDLGPLFLNEDGTLKMDLMPDQLHPNTAGYVIWAEAVEPIVKSILGGRAVNPYPRGDWWKQRFDEKQQRIKQGDIDLVLLGDSIIHNWDRHFMAIYNEFYGSRKAINLGFSGDRTEHVLWRLENGEMDGYTPKMVMLMIGTNNIGHRSSTPRQTIEGIRAILEKLGQKWPQTKVLLLAVFARGADENDEFRKAVNEINAGLPVLADGQRVVFLDINDKFLDENGNLPRDIMPDLLHPNEKGHRIWAEAVEPYVVKWVDGK